MQFTACGSGNVLHRCAPTILWWRRTCHLLSAYLSALGSARRSITRFGHTLWKRSIGKFKNGEILILFWFFDNPARIIIIRAECVFVVCWRQLKNAFFQALLFVTYRRLCKILRRLIFSRFPWNLHLCFPTSLGCTTPPMLSSFSSTWFWFHCSCVAVHPESAQHVGLHTRWVIVWFICFFVLFHSFFCFLFHFLFHFFFLKNYNLDFLYWTKSNFIFAFK